MTFLFLVKLIFVATGIAFATAPLGVFVLWKKMAYFGDAISHSAIFGLAIATILAVLPIYGIVACAIIFALLIFLINKQNLYSTDAVIGIVSCSLIAIGMILLHIFPNDIDLEEYLFGDLLNLNFYYNLMIYLIAALVMLFLFINFKPLLLTTINSDLAEVSGIKTEKLQLKFLLLCAFVIACLVKLVGIFLVVSIIILPAAIARNFSKTPIQMMIFSTAVSAICIIIGTLISINLKMPSAPFIIAFAVFVLAFSIISVKIRGQHN